MKVFVSPLTYDLTAALEIDALPSSDFGVMVRRGSRVATTDGGVAVNDFGYAAGDRTFQVNLKPARATDTALRYLVRTYSLVYVSTREGFFKAMPSYSVSSDFATLTLAVTEQLA